MCSLTFSMGRYSLNLINPAKFPNNAVVRYVLEGDYWLNRFKGLMTSLEKSNDNFNWLECNHDENKIKGLHIGAIFGEEEYEKMDGSIGTTTKVTQIRSTEIIKEGNYTVPEKKKLEKYMFGVEKEEDTYIGYFYLPLSSDVGKTENKENQGIGQYAKVEGKTLAEVFENIQFSTELEVNLRHASSMVIHKDLMNDDFLNELIAFVKKDAGIDYNFYLFVTEDKMEDIFQFENPNKESVIYSVLVSTLDSPSIYMAANPIHFVKFAREFYSNRCISFPLLLGSHSKGLEECPSSFVGIEKALILQHFSPIIISPI